MDRTIGLPSIPRAPVPVQTSTLIADGKRRRFDVVVCWRLDRLGRNLRHVVMLVQDLTDLGIGFSSLGERIDTQTTSGRLATAYPRGPRRIRKRTHSGTCQGRSSAGQIQGKRLGRPRHVVQRPSQFLEDLCAKRRESGVSRNPRRHGGSIPEVSPGILRRLPRHYAVTRDLSGEPHFPELEPAGALATAGRSAEAGS